MATAVKTYSDASVNGAADQSITTLSGLPSIPAGSTLNSVVLSFTCNRTGGRDDNEIRVRLGDTIHFYIQDLGQNDPRTCDITSIVRNNNGTLTYTDGSTSLNLYAYHTFKLFDNANWKLTNIKITANYTEKYTVTVSSNNSNYGYTTGSGTYSSGTALTMSAHPYAGYKFVQWSDGVTSNIRAVSVTGNATYTAQFRPIYISYDSVFSYKMWADTNLVTWDLMQIVNKTDTSFTGKALVEDSYTIESRPLIDLTGVNRWTFKCDTSSSDFEIFLFNCDASGAWADFNYTRSNEISINNVKGYLSIRCDIVGTGKEVTFSNFRLYPEQYPYMGNSVSAAERTGRGGQAMPTPTRAGYKFTGWNTKPDGTGTTYTASNLPNDDIVLYSQWEKSENQIRINHNFVGENECTGVYVQPSTKTIIFQTELASVNNEGVGADTVDGWHIRIYSSYDDIFKDLKANGLYEVVAVYRNGTLIY